MDPMTIGIGLACFFGCGFVGWLIDRSRKPSREERYEAWLEKPVHVPELTDWDEFGRRIESALEDDPWKKLPERSVDYIMGLTDEQATVTAIGGHQVPAKNPFLRSSTCKSCGNDDYPIENKGICSKCSATRKYDYGLSRRTPCTRCKKDSMTLDETGVCGSCRTCQHYNPERILYPNDPNVYYHCLQCNHMWEKTGKRHFRNNTMNEIVYFDDIDMGFGKFIKQHRVVRPGETIEVTVARYEELKDLVVETLEKQEETFEVDQKKGAARTIQTTPFPSSFDEMIDAL